MRLLYFIYFNNNLKDRHYHMQAYIVYQNLFPIKVNQLKKLEFLATLFIINTVFAIKITSILEQIT